MHKLDRIHTVASTLNLGMYFHQYNPNSKHMKLELYKKNVNCYLNIKCIHMNDRKLTSNAFDGCISGETWWAIARFEMIICSTFGVHSASLWLGAWINTLAIKANFLQTAFLI